MLAIYSYTIYIYIYILFQSFQTYALQRMQTDIDIKILATKSRTKPSSFHILLTREGGKQVDLLL